MHKISPSPSGLHAHTHISNLWKLYDYVYCFPIQVIIEVNLYFYLVFCWKIWCEVFNFSELQKKLYFQENGRHKSPSYGDVAPSEQFVTRQSYVSPAMVSVSGSSSPSGGLACAIAALAERQQTSGESSTNPGGNVPGFSMVPGTSRFYNRVDRESENYSAAVSSSEMSINHGMPLTQDDREWNADTTRTSYASSDTTEDAGSTSAPPTGNEIEGDLQNVPDPIVPESFEEQMMLAMAVSLAEARAVASGPGVPWQ